MNDESNPPASPLSQPDGLSVLEAEKLQAAIELLEALAADRRLLVGLDTATFERLLVAAGRVSRPDKAAQRALSKAREKHRRVTRRDDTDQSLSQTGIRKLRENPIFETPRRQAQFAAGHNGAAQAIPLFPIEGPRAEFEPEEALAQPESLSRPGPAPARVRKVSVQCYVCRQDFDEIHWFYDQLCPSCGDFNYMKRDPRFDLSGRYALVTGSRVKIGYQAAIMLLRNGCRVIATTRFPRDAARRFAAEADFSEWGHRLQIHGLDLRHIPSVEAFCERLLQTLPRLDFIINNACQTVRRPPGFYDHLMAHERRLEHDHDPVELKLLAEPERRSTESGSSAALALSAQRMSGVVSSAELSQVALMPSDLERGEHLFPTGSLDADQQQVDLREMNSWRLKLAEVETVELVEVHVVNAVAPFILNARLKPLMQRVPTADKHIVNVSAMEGQFYRSYKSDRHPHTNMAKASLNMMTRTSAADYIESGIHMNSVDTGWVTDEDPAAIAQRKREEHRFHPPLDIVDGAARIVDPIFDGLKTGRHVWGQFLKDYRITDW